MIAGTIPVSTRILTTPSDSGDYKQRQKALKDAKSLILYCIASTHLEDDVESLEGESKYPCILHTTFSVYKKHRHTCT